jgi:hypothetical protein
MQHLQRVGRYMDYRFPILLKINSRFLKIRNDHERTHPFRSARPVHDSSACRDAVWAQTERWTICGNTDLSSGWTETVYPQDGVSMSIASSSKYESLAPRPLHNPLQ